jgi:hypothetical protein
MSESQSTGQRGCANVLIGDRSQNAVSSRRSQNVPARCCCYTAMFKLRQKSTNYFHLGAPIDTRLHEPRDACERAVDGDAA